MTKVIYKITYPNEKYIDGPSLIPVSAFSNKLGVEMRAGSQGPCLGLRVDFD
jgi:hypothetical protein